MFGACYQTRDVEIGERAKRDGVAAAQERYASELLEDLLNRAGVDRPFLVVVGAVLRLQTFAPLAAANEEATYTNQHNGQLRSPRFWTEQHEDAADHPEWDTKAEHPGSSKLRLIHRPQLPGMCRIAPRAPDQSVPAPWAARSRNIRIRWQAGDRLPQLSNQGHSRRRRVGQSRRQ